MPPHQRNVDRFIGAIDYHFSSSPLLNRNRSVPRSPEMLEGERYKNRI